MRRRLPAALHDAHNLIARAAGKRFARAARPLHLDAIERGAVAQAEMKAGVVLRNISGAGLNLAR